MKKLVYTLALFASVVLAGCNSKEKENLVKDIDGNQYTVVRIGYQEWMVENLKVTHYNDGTPITYAPTIEDWQSVGEEKKGAWCVYDFYGTSDDAITANSYVTYGALYNFYAVESGKLAPEGWRVATEEDWQLLELWLNYDKCNYDDSHNGNKIAKAMADNTLWMPNDDEGAGDVGNKATFVEKNNVSGFTALPAGDRRYTGEYVFQGEQTFWWAATPLEGVSDFAYARGLSNTEPNLMSLPGRKGFGFAVRCVRDLDESEY